MKYIFIAIALLVGLSNFSQAQLLLTLTEDSSLPQSQHSANQLIASNVIAQRANVTYAAVESIILKPGFIARTGSIFSATIQAYPLETDESINNRLTVQAYPNPFYQETRMQYSLPGSSQVQGVLTSLEGKVLRQFTGAGRQERGIHYIDVSASDLPAGTYIYQIRTNTERKTIRLIKQAP